MKKILGLDLGTTSIGWAFVKEAETNEEKSEIVRIGVRVNPLSTDELNDFEKGKKISVNAGRTQKRSARRNLQRYKLRRNNLIEVLVQNKFIVLDTILPENGKDTTHSTFALRAKSASEKIELAEFARVLLAINKKRGYKSSRKAKNDEEGTAIDGMETAKILYEKDLTPGQFCYQQLVKGKKVLPDFYRSDLQNEFDKVWRFQKQFYPEIFTEEFYKSIQGQGLQNTRKRFLAIHGIFTAENKANRAEKQIQAYKWRSNAISEKLELSELAYVICEINNNLNNSSGYLGAISDRSKELFFNKETVGQYLYNKLKINPHYRIKGQIFYRLDYLDEFEVIWEKQKEFHEELTADLKKEIKDIVIFYQRRLKSQKSLISYCEFESRQQVFTIDGKSKIKTIGSRVVPKSSPIFQEFKIWQNLSNLRIKNQESGKILDFIDFDLEHRKMLFDELNIKGGLKKEEVLKLLIDKPKEWDLNFNSVEGNRTNQALYEVYEKILEIEGYEIDFKNSSALKIKDAVKSIFKSLGIETDILEFNAELDGKEFENQVSYQLWHLLYSYEGDNSNSGNNALYEILEKKYGFKKEYAQILSNINFQDDYGSLSVKAIRKIIPFIKEHKFDEACSFAGYNHSASLTKEENEKRLLKNKLDLLPKNSLRNPVVEKILNQMVNLINLIIEDEELGKPDEIRIELARDLKKNAKEREALTKFVNNAKNEHEKYIKILQKEFGVKNPTRNDLIRYKLYLELKNNGYKTLYSDTYIPQEKLFSKEFDIEHIIPKSRMFDDSFSNKTIESKQVNIDKSDDTAYDFVKSKYGKIELEQYQLKIEKLFKSDDISKSKYKKLLLKVEEIGEGFIERDLRETQYIAKKAKEMLQEICRNVLTTTGSITAQLREDWGIINVMQELSIEKYRKLGLTEQLEKKDGSTKERIVDWTKRSDHRHHAMDALTVAFTRHNHIQYLNNLNARKNENDKKHSNIIAIEKKETYLDENRKRKFNPPTHNFRNESKKHLENVLVSFKAKNKVVTRNKNKITGTNKVQTTFTPRGQMHNETVYGKLRRYETKEIKIGSKLDEATILLVSNRKYREALIKRLSDNNNDSTKAFSGKNSHAKNPVCYSDNIPLPEMIKLVKLETEYTIRKNIDPDLNIEKVIDAGIKRILIDRLAEFGGKADDAFSNLDKNPIWLNKEKGISIKRVRITGVKNAEALHIKRDNTGKPVLDITGSNIPSDYISTGNNHHVAIYKDEEGNLKEEIVSFYEAVARVNAGASIIKKNHENGWKFLFTMKQNEMFIIPDEYFDPEEIDLSNIENYHLVSPHLYRVQKFGSLLSGFWFRHHLETNVDVRNELKGTTFKVIQSMTKLKRIIKVRINHLGKIVHVGDY